MGEPPGPDVFEAQTPYLSTQPARPDGGDPRPCLVVLAGPLLGEIICFHGRDVVIGRHPDADVALVEDEGVSRQHARLSPTLEGARLVDLGSANGTFVDGERGSEWLLSGGEKIRVGQTTV